MERLRLEPDRDDDRDHERHAEPARGARRAVTALCVGVLPAVFAAPSRHRCTIADATVVGLRISAAASTSRSRSVASSQRAISVLGTSGAVNAANASSITRHATSR